MVRVGGCRSWGNACHVPAQVSELETLPRDVSRLAYTQRILEIVGNIRKQKEEITKVHHCGPGVGHRGRQGTGWPRKGSYGL